ncbi:MAG: Do family serine endopeptidase [Bacteroidales bacterium]|nr:Do family serine endopeptidase [Bacteroidales bacterium]
MNFKRNLGTILTAIVTALLTVVIYSSITDNGNQSEKVSVSKRSFENDTNGIHFTNLPADFQADQFNFTLAAENTVHAVAHVKTKFTRDAQYSNPFYEFFFGDRYQRPQREVEGMGSGVIISSDGYIVTNNHVVERADNVAVTLNDGRTMEAEIVGNDPATDLALLKIDAKDLPSLKFGSSQDIKLGEWVLAVGNPFDIGTTVTAGIVSAKGRNIGVLRQRGQQGNQLAIESFIQTDAAVNKGNSGGALVNIEGELIGINAAIASPTGSYSGYSFAIPAAIAKKVVEDLIKYGEVQRAMLNVQISNINDQIAKEFDLETYKGALVRAVGRDGAADKSGIKPGDVIIQVDGKDIKDVADLQTTINSYRPGEEVTVTVKREGKEKQFDVTLRNRQGSTELVTSEQTLEKLGAQFKSIDEKLKQRIGISYGVQVVSLEEGALSNADIREGFIITAIEGRKIRNVNDIKQIFSEVPAGSKVRVEGLYPGGDYVYVYQVEMPE